MLFGLVLAVCVAILLVVLVRSRRMWRSTERDDGIAFPHTIDSSSSDAWWDSHHGDHGHGGFDHGHSGDHCGGDHFGGDCGGSHH